MNGGIIGARNNPDNGLVFQGNKPRGGLWTVNDLFAGLSKPFIVLPSGATLWDSLDSATGITAEKGAVAVISAPRLEGAGALSLAKTATDVAYCRAYKDSLSPTIAVGALTQFGILFHVKDATALAKMRRLKLSLGTSATARVTGTISSYAGEIGVGWNRQEIMPDQVRGGDYVSWPTLTACDFWLIEIQTYNNSDTLAEGDVVFDCIYYR